MVSQFNLLQNVPNGKVLLDYFLTDGGRKRQLPGKTTTMSLPTSRVNVTHVVLFLTGMERTDFPDQWPHITFLWPW